MTRKGSGIRTDIVTCFTSVGVENLAISEVGARFCSSRSISCEINKIKRDKYILAPTSKITRNLAMAL